MEQIKQSGAFYSQRKPYEDAFLFQDICKRHYRAAMDTIHKTIHPFDEQGQFKQQKAIDQSIRQSIQQIEWQLIRSKAATKTDDIGNALIDYQKVTDGLKTETLLKLQDQLPDILQAIEQWQQWTRQRASHHAKIWYHEYDMLKQGFSIATLENYLIHYLLPWVYSFKLKACNNGPSK